MTRDATTDVVTVTSTATAENNDIVAFDQSGTLVLQENNGSLGLTPGAGCLRAENPPNNPLPNVVTCGVTSTASLIGASLGPGDDTFESTTSAAKTIPETLNGEAGNDQLFGNDGNDILDGGDGDDVLDGGAGLDTIVYDRAAGTTVDATLPNPTDSPVDIGGVSVGTSVANGARDIEDDTLTSRDENLQGGAEMDNFLGNDGANVLNGSGGDDSLDGMGGNDTLQGFGGNDWLSGGEGTDTFSAGAGDDIVDARDDLAETSIDCGTGTDDRLQADNTLDNVNKTVNGCEVLAPQRTSGTGAISGTGQEGQTLTAPLAAYSGDAVTMRDFVWFRCTGAGTDCVAIDNANVQTYTLTAADVGKYIGVTEFANNSGGGDDGFSNYVGPVNAKPADAGQPQTAQPGATQPATQQPTTQQQPQQPETAPVPKAPTVSAGGTAGTTAQGAGVLADTGIVVGCPAGSASCQAAVQATAPAPKAKRGKPAKAVVVGKTSISVAGGQTAKVTFKLTRAGAALLRRVKKLRVTVTVVTTGGGAPQTTAKTLTLRAPKAKKRH